MKRFLVIALLLGSMLVFAQAAQAAYGWFTVNVVNVTTQNDTGFALYATDQGGTFTNKQFGLPTAFSQAGKSQFIANVLTAVSSGKTLKIYADPNTVNSIYAVQLVN